MGKCLFMRKGETHTSPKQGLPSGYTKLTYIENTGTQYIDTEVAFSADNYNKIKLSVDMDSANASGAYEVNGTGTTNTNCFYVGNNNGTLVYGNGKSDVTTGKTHQTGRCLYTIDAKNKVVCADGVDNISFTPVAPTANVNLYVCGFGRANGTATGFSGKLYAAQIWINDVLVRDFIPCINPSGEIGMYDMVGKKFYGNAGTGVFKCNLDFENCTWAEVIEACQTNNVPSIWQVGDQKTMTINGTNYPIDIIGKNHDDYADGSGKAPLTFQMHDLYDDSFAMNTINTNQNGWNNSNLRKTKLPNIIANMPSEIQYGIKEVNKRASRGTTLVAVDTSVDKLFLLSEEEVFGTLNFCAIGEGSQYAYYAAGNSKLKVHHTSGSKDYWWLRSPYINSMSQFCYVGADGTVGIANATGTNGIAFAFCF